MSAVQPEGFGFAAIVERLRQAPLFAALGDAELQRLARMGTLQQLEPDQFLIREGDAADAMYLVLEGEMLVTKRSGTSEIPLDRVEPGSLQGDIAALAGGRRLASVKSLTHAEVFTIPISAIRELLAAGPDIALAIISTAVQRQRGMEATLREREKLAGLGLLAAGVAHELNNPAAAALRSVAALRLAMDKQARPPEVDQLPAAPTPPDRPLTSLERSDRIRELTELAGADAAQALADAGWSAADLREAPAGAVAWAAAQAEMHQLLDELHMALERITDIVGAVKGYAALDRAPVQRVDVARSLRETLVILRHRLAGIEVQLDVDPTLAPIDAYGSELGQVWTNIIDNAVDAMEGDGRLEICVGRDTDSDGVCVTICDSGPGIPQSARGRLFEPFYTTKAPGKGTGLGLHIAHRVVWRHGGRIDVQSEPGRTCFVVTLPATILQEPLPSPGE